MASVQKTELTSRGDELPWRRRGAVFHALLGAVALLVSSWVARCDAQMLPAYPTAASPSAAAWFPDRYPPSVFENAGAQAGRSDVLRLGVAAADGQNTRPPVNSSAFYNTQGRKIQVGGIAAPVSWIGSLYIPSAWSTPSLIDGSGSRRSDLWSTLWPASGGDTCPGAGCDVFPIVGFSNAAFPDHDNNPGGTPRYRVFDGANGGWIDLAAAVTYDGWTDFCATFTGTAVEYRIGGQLVYTASNLAQADQGFGPVTQLADVTVQAYNYGYTYDSAWSRLAAGSGSCADLTALFEPPTPTPTDTALPTDTPTAVPTDTAPPTVTPTSSATPPATATPTIPPTPTATALCPATPRTDCRAARKSVLVLRQGATPARNRLTWKWIRGAALAPSDLPSPMGSAGYALCLYSGAGQALIAAAQLPAGSSWNALPAKGYRYRDTPESAGGLQKALLRSGADGKSKGFAKGKGSHLVLPPLGNLPLPLAAQLLSPQGGACLGSLFDAGAVISNDARRFKAKVQP